MAYLEVTIYLWCLNEVGSEICALLGYYTPSSGNPLLTFRDEVSVPSSRVKKKRKPARRCAVYIGKGVGGDVLSKYDDSQ